MQQFCHLPVKVANALKALHNGKSSTLHLPKQYFPAPDVVVEQTCAALLGLGPSCFQRVAKINFQHNNLGDGSAVPLGRLMNSENGGCVEIVSVAHNNMSSIGITQVSKAVICP